MNSTAIPEKIREDLTLCRNSLNTNSFKASSVKLTSELLIEHGITDEESLCKKVLGLESARINCINTEIINKISIAEAACSEDESLVVSFSFES